MDLFLFHRPGLALQALSDVSFIISRWHIAVSLDSLMKAVIQKKNTPSTQPAFPQALMCTQAKYLVFYKGFNSTLIIRCVSTISPIAARDA